MELNIGATIELIRIEKNISITSLIDNIISRSQYYKIVNNYSEMSAVKFLNLIDRLNITLDEFVFIGNNYRNENYSAYFTLINHQFSNRNITELKALESKLLQAYEKSQNTKYRHLYILCLSLRYRAEGKVPNELYENELKNYFSHLNYFTRYDIVIYTNTMFLYSSEYNNVLFKSIMKGISKFDTLKRNEKEVVRILSNIIIMELEEFNVENALKHIDILNNMSIPDEMIYEQILAKFFKGISIYYSCQKEQGILMVDECITFLKYLDNSYCHLLENVWDFCKKNELKEDI